MNCYLSPGSEPDDESARNSDVVLAIIGEVREGRTDPLRRAAQGQPVRNRNIHPATRCISEPILGKFFLASNRQSAFARGARAGVDITEEQPRERNESLIAAKGESRAVHERVSVRVDPIGEDDVCRRQPGPKGVRRNLHGRPRIDAADVQRAPKPVVVQFESLVDCC